MRLTIELPHKVRDCGYDTPCYIWTGMIAGGYGVINGVGTVHRLVYQQEVGPIPDGLQLDHLCRQRACFRPDHLEPVSAATNSRRGIRTKLTEEAVARARAAKAGTKLTGQSPELLAICEEFGVQMSTLRKYRSKNCRQWQ